MARSIASLLTTRAGALKDRSFACVQAIRNGSAIAEGLEIGICSSEPVNADFPNRMVYVKSSEMDAEH